MFGSAARRRRRSLWVILSLLFALGVAVSTVQVDSERNGALDSAVERARHEARLAKASLTEATHPTGHRSELRRARRRPPKIRLVERIHRGVTVWSSRGRILFSLNESLVGKTPGDGVPDHRGEGIWPDASRRRNRADLHAGLQGSGWPRRDRAGRPATRGRGGTDRGRLEQGRLGSVLGLVVSSLCLALTFVPLPRRMGARENEEWPGTVGGRKAT